MRIRADGIFRLAEKKVIPTKADANKTFCIIQITNVNTFQALELFPALEQDISALEVGKNYTLDIDMDINAKRVSGYLTPVKS